MRTMIYCVSNYNIVIDYPNYLEVVMKFVTSRIKVRVERAKLNGQEFRGVVLDEGRIRS